MKKLSLLLSLLSIVTLAWCTTTLTGPSSDIITSTGTQTTVSTNSYLYPEDTLYAYFAQHSTLQSGESIGECYALRENAISEDDIKAGIYSWIETDIHRSKRMYYSVSEIHKDACRWWAGDPQTSPTIGWFLIIGGDVYEENPAEWSYTRIGENMDNVFRKNQNIYPLDTSHHAEKRIFDYLQRESDLLTGESAQHCFWLSDYETSSEQISQEIFSPLPWDQLEPLVAFTAHRSQNIHCRWGVKIEDNNSEWRAIFAIIGNILYRQRRGDEIDAAGGERWKIVE